MKDVVEDINVHSYSETLTGVFLSYPNHFVHVLEVFRGKTLEITYPLYNIFLNDDSRVLKIL